MAPNRKPRVPPKTRQITQLTITIATIPSLGDRSLQYIVTLRDQMRPAIMARNAHLNLRVRPPLKAELAKLATKIGAFSAPMLKGYWKIT
jgi:hypothetical protein